MAEEDCLYVWRGDFYSNTIPSVRGKIKVLLPTTSKHISSLGNTNATITYTGTFRYGMSVAINMKVEADEEKMRASGKLSNQTFTLHAAYTSTPKVIAGTYTSTSPNDEGTFSLQLTTQTELTTATLSSCCVC